MFMVSVAAEHSSSDEHDNYEQRPMQSKPTAAITPSTLRLHNKSPGTNSIRKSQSFNKSILTESKKVPVPISHNHASSCDDEDDDSLLLLETTVFRPLATKSPSETTMRQQNLKHEVVDLCESSDESDAQVNFSTCGTGRTPFKSPAFNTAARHFPRSGSGLRLVPPPTAITTASMSNNDDDMDVWSHEDMPPSHRHTASLKPTLSNTTKEPIHARRSQPPTQHLVLQRTPWNAGSVPSQTSAQLSTETWKSDASKKRRRLREASNPHSVRGVVSKTTHDAAFQQVSQNVWFRPNQHGTAAPVVAPASFRGTTRNDLCGGSGVGAGSFVLQRTEDSTSASTTSRTTQGMTHKTKKAPRKNTPTGYQETTATTKAAKTKPKKTRAVTKKGGKKKRGGWSRKNYRSKGGNNNARNPSVVDVPVTASRDPWSAGYQHRTTQVSRRDADLQHVGGATISF